MDVADFDKYWGPNPLGPVGTPIPKVSDLTPKQLLFLTPVGVKSLQRANDELKFAVISDSEEEDEISKEIFPTERCIEKSPKEREDADNSSVPGDEILEPMVLTRADSDVEKSVEKSNNNVTGDEMLRSLMVPNPVDNHEEVSKEESPTEGLTLECGHLDPYWTAWENLCLVSCVLHSRDQRWASVSCSMNDFSYPDRRDDWFTPDRCIIQYYKLLEYAEIARRNGQMDRGESHAEYIIRCMAQRMKVTKCNEDLNWTTWENLWLALAVLRGGDQDWISVSHTLREFGEPDRPEDWFTPERCAMQYAELLVYDDFVVENSPERKGDLTTAQFIVRYMTERLMRTSRIDTRWSTWENLCLAKAVLHSGDQDWMSVSHTLKEIRDQGLSEDSFMPRNCAKQYAGLFYEYIETDETLNHILTVETAAACLVRILTEKRIKELQRRVKKVEMRQQSRR